MTTQFTFCSLTFLSPSSYLSLLFVTQRVSQQDYLNIESLALNRFRTVSHSSITSNFCSTPFITFAARAFSLISKQFRIFFQSNKNGWVRSNEELKLMICYLFTLVLHLWQLLANFNWWQKQSQNLEQKCLGAFRYLKPKTKILFHYFSKFEEKISWLTYTAKSTRKVGLSRIRTRIFGYPDRSFTDGATKSTGSSMLVNPFIKVHEIFSWRLNARPLRYAVFRFCFRIILRVTWKENFLINLTTQINL